MNFRPLVSICLPCFNGERFIRETLESVLNQTFKDFEVIIVDDYSTDRTLSVIQAFADSRIKVLQNGRNLGMGANWQKVLSCSRGKYVKLLGQDDLLSPECLSRQVTVLEHPANEKVVLTACKRTVVDSKGNVILR